MSNSIQTARKFEEARALRALLASAWGREHLLFASCPPATKDRDNPPTAKVKED